jgi:hypothetical protein
MSPSRRGRRKSWRHHVGVSAPIVHLEEREAKGGRVYARWWDRDNWKSRSLGLVVRRDGVLDEALVQAAITAGERLRHGLTGETDPASRAARPRATWATAWGLLTDPATGRYATDTMYRRQLQAALRDARLCLGHDPAEAMASFDQASLRKLLRWKAADVQARGHTGYRTVQKLGTNLLTILRVLREDGHLPADLAIPEGKSWPRELRRYFEERDGALPEIQRPRYTLEESIRLHRAAAEDPNPRARLFVALGAELRPAQVLRAKRSALQLDHGVCGRFVVRGKGDKLGEVVELTAGQRAAVDAALDPEAGYLRGLEAAYQAGRGDYLLFPMGRLIYESEDELWPRIGLPASMTPTSRRTAQDWWHGIEQRAGVPHLPGRGIYGLRRVSVDVALEDGLDEDALMALGGWSSDRTPKAIYRDAARSTGREAARNLRAKLRGEESPAPSDTRPTVADPYPTATPEGAMLTMESRGLEPLTSSLQRTCATSCATTPTDGAESSSPACKTAEQTEGYGGDCAAPIYSSESPAEAPNGAEDSATTVAPAYPSALSELTAGAGWVTPLHIALSAPSRGRS